MRRAWLLSTAVVSLSTACALAACAAGTDTNMLGGAGGTSSASSSSGAVTGGGGGIVTVPTDGGGGGPALDFLAYAHTGDTLYKFDPKNVTAAPIAVGQFDCNAADGSMYDIAVNKNGDIWGITAKKAYPLTIQGGSVHCGNAITLGDGSVTFYALTFAPEGVIGSGETLIAGNTDGELWAINTSTGALEQHGNFGKVPSTDGNGHDYDNGNVGKRWELSGDIVFLANGSKPVGFATVRDCPNPPSKTGCNLTDTLIQIDMTKLKTVGTQSVTSSVRGQILEGSGCSATGTAPEDYQQLLGIAAWNDKVYGFSQSGAIVAIDNDTAEACRLVMVSGTKWYGAGVTTIAPVVVPPA